MNPKIHLKVCVQCGVTFNTSHVRQQYCTPKCSNQRWRKPDAQIIAERVVKTDGCWKWTGAHNIGGYGYLVRRDIQASAIHAHRFVYGCLVAPIPSDMDLDHLCRNRWCVNPAHMQPVTRRENILRGISPCANNARKTTCPRGHPYNRVYVYNGRLGRRCSICDNALKNRVYHARSAASLL
jgi:hypothetical protein